VAHSLATPHLAGTFHSSTVVSIPPEASSLPSAVNASAVTRPCAPFNSPAAFPVAGSHNRTEPSAPDVASSLPSGENASASRPTPKAPAGTSILRGSLPVAPSHRRTGGPRAPPPPPAPPAPPAPPPPTPPPP